MESNSPGVRDGSTYVSDAPLSTSNLMNEPSEQSVASGRSAEVAMNAPKTPRGRLQSSLGVSEDADTDAAGWVADSAEGILEAEDDAAASAREAPIALNENPNVVGSGCGGCAR